MSENEKNTEVQEEKSNIVSTIIVTLVLSVVVAVLGWFVGSLSVNKITVDSKNHSLNVKKSAKNKEKNDSKIIMLNPILTNIVSNMSDVKKDKYWIRVEIGLVTDSNFSLKNEDKAKIINSLLAYFRTMNVTNLLGPSGLMHLKFDILDRVNILTENKVKAVILPVLIVE